MSNANMFVMFILAALTAGCASSVSKDSEPILTNEHYVSLPSDVNGLAGGTRIYVRERMKASTILGGASAPDRVVLFVHGAGTPADVAFDVPREGYSWMAYLAAGGLDVFSMDHTGYGRSTRPASMEDPCNLSPKHRPEFVRDAKACKPFEPAHLSDIDAEWREINAVVDYLRKLRRADRIHLVAWSRGGPRAGGFAARHPNKVHRMVLLAPAYNRNASATAPAKIPPNAALMNTQDRAQFMANWKRQIRCDNQYEPATADSVWSAMLASDPVGAKWGGGVRRAPSTTVWGWTPAVVGKSKIPTLMVVGEHDKQVAPDRVQQLYSDWGSPEKVYVELACSSHNAMWEKNRMALYRASFEWLTKGTVGGERQGTLRLGD
jgi:pimeloyl-ACP methyl ester carboxylesterase